jgi:hypothetical protein
MKILNADKLIKEDKAIVLNGREYKIPANLPVRIVVRMMGLTQDYKTNPEDYSIFEKQIDLLFEVFSIKNKNIKREDFDLTMEQYVEISKFLSGVKEDGDQGNVEISQGSLMS